MDIYKTNGLTSFQNIHKEIINTSQGSWVNKVINQIQDFNDFENIKYHIVNAHIQKRLLVVALPWIALADSAKSLMLAARNVIKLEGRDALYALACCAKALKIFIFSILTFVIAIISPTVVYHSEEGWIRLMKQQVEQQIFSSFNEKKLEGSASNDALKEALTEVVDQFIKNDEAKKVFNRIVSSIEKQVSKVDESKEEIIKREYVELFSEFLIDCVTKNIPLHLANESFNALTDSYISLRNPELRLNLFKNLLKVFEQDPSIINQWMETFPHIKENHYSPLFILYQAIKDKSMLDRFITLLSEPYFKDQIKLTEFIGILLKLINSSISKDEKEKILKLILDCYQFDLNQEAKSEKSENQNIVNPTGVKKQIANKEKLLQEKIKRVSELKGKSAPELQIKQIEENIEKVKKDIEDLKKSIENQGVSLEELRKQIMNKENAIVRKKVTIDALKSEYKPTENIEAGVKKLEIEVDNLKKSLQVEEEKQQLKAEKESSPQIVKSKPAKILAEFLNGLKNLNLILSLNDLSLLTRIIDEIGEDKKYPRLSSNEFIEDLFQTIFHFDKPIDNISQAVSNLRAPEALILFHSRLKELKGMEREKALDASSKFVMHALNGNLWEERHNEKNHPHLRKIFSQFPELKEKWMSAKPAKVGDFVSKEKSQKFYDYTIRDTHDPCDLVLLGVELDSCVHLNGRVNKIHGLLGIALDGKIHTIVVSDEKGHLCAETQLMLMWDDVNKKPVLFLEYINFKRHSPNDHCLRKAVQGYCKQFAKKLNLDLVTIYGKNNVRNTYGDIVLVISGKNDSGKSCERNNKGLEKYSGRVKSLGTSAPVELVNVFHAIRKGSYDLGQTYVLQAADEQQEQASMTA